MRSLKGQLGFTLQEMMIAIAVMAVLGIAGVPAIKREMQESVDNQGVEAIKDAIAGFKQFRAVERRNPATMAELVGSEFYQGNGVTPWGAAIAGTPSATGRSYSFTIPARDADQAERLAGMLAEFSPTVAGSLITLTSPVSTIETVEDQMLCRRDIGVADCNVMEVTLDAGNQDILGADEVQGNLGRLNTVISSDAQIDRLITNDEIVLGANSISHSGNTLQFNAGRTSFSGDISLQGNLTGNNSNISGVNRLEADTVSSTTANIDEGVISELSGVSLDYQTGVFNTVEAQDTIADIGDFGTANADTVNSNEVITNTFQGNSGTINNLTAQSASGSSLTLTGLMDVGSFDADSSDIGVATGNSLNLSGNASGNSTIFNSGSFGSVNVSGNVSGGDFQGNDFTTSLSSVNQNKSRIDQHAQDIADNAADNNTNRNNINALESDVQSNTNAIAANASDIVSNRQLAQNNAGRISDNAGAINVLEGRATQIESGIASLRNQWASCEAQGGCQ